MVLWGCKCIFLVFILDLHRAAAELTEWGCLSAQDGDYKLSMYDIKFL